MIYRNPGHWYIRVEGLGRVFAIRGAPGAYYVRDHREGHQSEPMTKYASVQTCMAFICDALMFELILAEGQQPKIIESWNIE